MMRPAEPPRYRIEHRDGDRSPLIVAFADALTVAYREVATRRPAMTRQRTGGELVVVDQETGADVKAFPLTR
jgi:hypothetical protein